MEHVSSVRPTGKFPEKVENLKRWSRFPGWNFRTECRVPFTFLVVCTSSRSTVGHPATYRGLRLNGTTFYRSEIPLLLPPKFPGFFRKWKAPFVSGPISAVVVRENVWEPLKFGLILGYCWLCARSIWKLQNFHVVTCNKEGLPGRKLCIFLETDFSQRTLVVIKFSSTSKLSETLQNFMISVTTAVSNT